MCVCMIYRKRQKLSERKVSWLTGFHLNVGKTFADLSRFFENLQKLQNFSLAQLLSFTVRS